MTATKRFDLTRPSYDLFRSDGNYISYMHLNGFGRGVAFAALPSGSGTALAPIRYTANASRPAAGRRPPAAGRAVTLSRGRTRCPRRPA